MSEQVPDGMEEEEECEGEEIIEPDNEVYSDGDTVTEPASPNKEQKFVAIDLPFTDEQGVEQTRRITVPVLREMKERKYKIVKRRRMVSPEIIGSIQDAEEEVEEEYEACMLVETITKTVLIRDVDESGDVEEREQDIIEEYYIGRERKYRYVTIEKTDEDGTTHEVEELEVESEEEEEEKTQKTKKIRKRFFKKHYDSQNELIAEDYEYEWVDEKEGSVREELSLVEKGQEGKEIGGKEVAGEEEEQIWEEEMFTVEEEQMALGEILKEAEKEKGEEETEWEEISKETSFEKELKKHKFEETPQEASEVEVLKKHRIKLYDKYKEEEEAYQKEIDKVRKSLKDQLDKYKQLLLEAIRNNDKKSLERLTKEQDLTEKVENMFKFEELMAKERIKRFISTLSTEQIKYLLSSELDRSDIADKEKEFDPLQLDKMMKELKRFQKEANERRMELETEQKKFRKSLEIAICRRREADFVARKKKEFLKKKPLIEKKLEERKETYWALKKYWRDWDKAVKKSIKEDYKTRFPAIYYNQKKIDAEGICFKEILNRLKKHCPDDFLKKTFKPEWI